MLSRLFQFLSDDGERWPQFRTLGPMLLGAFPWLDDVALLEQLTPKPWPNASTPPLTSSAPSATHSARTERRKSIMSRVGPLYAP